MKKVAVIGGGKLGTTLGHALSLKGYTIASISCRSLPSAEKSADIIGQGIPLINNIKAAESAEMVILSVPDEGIKEVSDELSSIDTNQKFIFHCSGILSSEILNPLKKSGALTASIHPIQSFPAKSRNPGAFKDIYFSMEGDKKAIQISKRIIKKLGGYSFLIEPKHKPVYHAACSVASNYLVVLLALAEELLKKGGINKEIRKEMLLPLVKGTLDNLAKNSIPKSLTGPVVRGDAVTLQSHLDHLQNNPQVLRIYKELGQQALQLVRKEDRLPQNKIKEIKALLE